MTDNAQWQGLYEAAMLELNPTELLNKIGIAQDAIRRRCEDLMHADSSCSSEERRAIADALTNLGALERLELKLLHAARSQKRHTGKSTMKRMCRDLSAALWSRRRSPSALLRHARFVTDPRKLAQLHAQADQGKRLTESRRKDMRLDDAVS